MARLVAEKETSLADRLKRCAEVVHVICDCCHHSRAVERGCKNKWCPVCCRKSSAKRVAKYQLAVSMMQWPLFLTLTCPHTDHPPLQRLRNILFAFSKLRRKKLWTDRTLGGIRGLEIDSRSGKLHEHLHMVIDCKWLAHMVPPPQRGDSKSRLKEKCLAASQELGMAWARCLGYREWRDEWSGVIYNVTRANRDTIAKEIIKYSVKGSDLLKHAGRIGPIIRALQCTRATQSFGSLFGKRRIEDGAAAKKRECEKCGSTSFHLDEVELEKEWRQAIRARR